MEKISVLNQRLKDVFGIDTESGDPIWRISWSSDQLEVIHAEFNDYTSEGLFLRCVKETRTVPKYPFNPNLYVLERLVVVPIDNLKELVAVKKSYEPIWFFEDAHGNPTPPVWRFLDFCINLIYTTQGKAGSMARYVKSPEEDRAEYEKRIKGIINELYGDESGLGGQTVTNSGDTIIVP